MVDVRNLLFILVAVVLLVQPSLAAATVATGTVTDRSVFTLNASGAAKVLAAETKVAQAVRIMGALGKISGYVGVGLVIADIAQNTWDWWHQDFDSGLMGSNVSDAVGSWGVNTTVGQPSNIQTGWAMFGPDYASSATCSGGMPGAGMVVVGEQIVKLFPSTCNGHAVNIKINYWFYNPSALPTTSVGSGAGGTDRSVFTSALDSTVAYIQSAGARASSALSSQDGGNMAATLDILRAARDYVSNGVPLVSTDYTHGTGWDSGSAAISGNSVPSPVSAAAPPGVDISGVSSAVSAMSGAATSAIAASQSAVVSAVQSVVSAVQAIPAAVAAAAVATYTPIVAAITASQAAVVSAVQSVAAPIVTAINEAKTAIVSAVSSAPAGGGSAGTTTAVESLAAQATARNTAAESAAAAAAPADVVCPECVREDKWSQAWETLRSAGQAAPVFGLINRIVINPVGTIERVRTVNTSNFGALTFNLNQWGIDTYIGVVRYVVIFAALIAGYFVIFG